MGSLECSTRTAVELFSITQNSSIAQVNLDQTISNLINCVKSDTSCLNDIICETKGKQRKLGKNVIQNIVTYLI